MTYEVLKPSLDCLRQEYVLVQAWKKASNYIRYHNWYSDTLALDRATANLPKFIAEIMKGLEVPEQWESEPLRLVLAPKSQKWRVSTDKKWEPVESGDDKLEMRPLAHVSLRDQVVATAVMLCLANKVETAQQDPRVSFKKAEDRKRVVSYGNRLFCDREEHELLHRWGSTKLYRSYYQDYRSFISRPNTVAESIESKDGQHVIIVETDLDKFYDRVRPEMLMYALDQLRKDDEDQEFFDFAKTVLTWRWDENDEADIEKYAKHSELDDFTRVALPQGLVAAGFFANVVLLAFDQRLQDSFGKEIRRGVRLEDACRYVDDLRLVVTSDLDVDECKMAVEEWLQSLLNGEAKGLLISEKKTEAVEFGASQRPIVRQSERMKRIQESVSGPFGIAEGWVLLDMIQGLVRSQQDLDRIQSESGWDFSPKSDVHEERVARFAANRFRTTYRFIRPLFEDRRFASEPERTDDESEEISSESELFLNVVGPHSRQELDEDAKEFALRIIERWIEDPSNVRLLWVGLDIWPDPEILKEVLRLLKPYIYTSEGPQSRSKRQVAWYCLSEVLRRGATETSIVDDKDCLPDVADLRKYREILCAEAAKLASPKLTTIPWYLRQQALLFLACFAPAAAPNIRTSRKAEIIEYHKLILFLRGESSRLSSSEFATLSVVARRAILDADKSVELVRWGLTADRKNAIANMDPSFALELKDVDLNFDEGLSAGVKESLCLENGVVSSDLSSLAETVLGAGSVSSLRNELSILRFAVAFLEKLRPLNETRYEIIPPGRVRIELEEDGDIAKVSKLEVSERLIPSASSLYAPPNWCEPDDRWRFQLGFLLRFILTRQADFTSFPGPEYWKVHHATYRPVRSHWQQRIYGLYNGQSAFGDDWMPITDWMERFLLMLLRWPGCRTPNDFEWVKEGIRKTKQKIKDRIKCLEEQRGAATQTLMMPMIAEWPTERPKTRSLRGCVVQTVVPQEKDFDNCDITFSQTEIRRKHRNHLSAALEAVKKMLYLRKTHLEDDGRLDWLILPELAVHPDDVKTHLIPFAQKFKSIILAGLTYQKILDDKQPVNSALWILPRQPEEKGLQILTRRQGKLHIAPVEKKYDVDGFRPCQWLIGYPWSETDTRPLWLSGAVCYDATDLNLAADLRNESDVFAIPAFNKDVGTFDQMANALNYHMFQHVIVVNNGLYGGSNAYWPVHDKYKRQIFHLHGQPQASIAFFEIEDIGKVLDRRRLGKSGGPSEKEPVWKSPPAGLKRFQY
ncbi:MAG: RNA-directed DNA polymerase [Caldilineaceae bacterium]|nr:RNA-directed DNA polymerase [Caldilineaceae bacterium]